jgi:hypothetical protein
MIPLLDFTVPFDDALTGRLGHCALCGRPAPEGQAATWGVPEDGRTVAVALVLCPHCLRAPDWWARLDQRYRQRYGFPEGVVVVRTQV